MAKAATVSPGKKASSFSATSPVPPVLPGIQFLGDGVIKIYMSPDQCLTSNREEILTSVMRYRESTSASISDGCTVAEDKKMEQVKKLLALFLDWLKSHQKRIASAVSIVKFVEQKNKSHLIRAVFIVSQANKDAIDEELWLDAAEFDYKVAHSKFDRKTFRIEARIKPIPYLDQDELFGDYLKHYSAKHFGE